MTEKSNPSVSIPETDLDEFDELIWELQAMKKLPKDANRSDVLTVLIKRWNRRMKEEYPEVVTRMEGEGVEENALDEYYTAE